MRRGLVGRGADEARGWWGRVAALPVLRPLLEVHNRYGALNGNQIAAAITLQGFLALFPLALVAVAVLGFVSVGAATDVPGEIARTLGLTGQAAQLVTSAVETAERSRRTASVVGLAGLAWSGLGLVSAVQFAYNQVWGVKGRGVRDKLVALRWLAGATVLFAGGLAATALVGFLPGVLAPLGIIASFVAGVGLFWWTSKVLPNRDVGWRPLLPGAILGALGLEGVKLLGAYYVPRAVASSSELYGSLGVVFALLAWLLLLGRLVVYSAVLDVVRHERSGARRAGTR